MYVIDVYKRGVGIIKKFPNQPTLDDVNNIIERYCKENNLHIVAKEYFDNSHWNYLNDGSEIDFCII